MSDSFQIELDEAKKAGVEPMCLYGRCEDRSTEEGSNFGGVMIHLFKVEGWTKPIIKLASALTDEEGEYWFDGLIPERPVDQINPLTYLIVADAAGRPYGCEDVHSHNEMKGNCWPIGVEAHSLTVTGIVIDTEGAPIEGAIVSKHETNGRPIPGYLSTRTDARGHFELIRVSSDSLLMLERAADPDGNVAPSYSEFLSRTEVISGGLITVKHPEFLPACQPYWKTSPEVKVTLSKGCLARGHILRATTELPASNVIVRAIRDKSKDDYFHAESDGCGQFHLMLPPGTYDFVTLSPDYIAPAIVGIECKVGGNVQLPTWYAEKPGVLLATLRDLHSGNPVGWDLVYDVLMIESNGPFDPDHFKRTAHADEKGRIELWLAPGKNDLRYLINMQHQRDRLCLRDGSPLPESVDIISDQALEIDIFHIPPPTDSE